MVTHSGALAWKILRTEETGGLWSMGSQRVRHVRATYLLTYTQWTKKQKNTYKEKEKPTC